MKILLSATLVPFMYGGAEYHIEGLKAALQEHGHEVCVLRLPFFFSPESSIHQAMEYASSLDMCSPNGISVDRAISLQFPAWGIQHPHHTVWVMHQHRACYELWNADEANKKAGLLQEAVHVFDKKHLSKAQALFANSERVAERLATYSGLTATPLYHPPHCAGRLYNAEAWDYIFYPSRLESLKRQQLLIEAAYHLKSPVKIIIAGEGGQRNHYQALIEHYQLEHRVMLVGQVSEEEKLAWYAHALAVFFGPYDEDYGYITLEAMLSSKPVITCTDSGGPLEFVEDGNNGWVVEPDARAVANAIDVAWHNKQRSADMGRSGYDAYHAAGISWHEVVQQLIGKESA